MRVVTKQISIELTDRIDVYETEGNDKKRTRRVVIYFKFVGYLDIHGDALSFTEDIRQGIAVEYVSCEPQQDILEGAQLKKEQVYKPAPIHGIINESS